MAGVGPASVDVGVPEGDQRAPSGLHPRLEQPAFGQLGIGSAGQAPASSADPRFATGDLLGVGTTGEVFTVEDRNLQRAVAIKIIPPQLRGDQEAIAHLVDEARITASLAHPNVLPVYDLDLDRNGRAYFSMKRIDGRSLGDVIQQSNLERRDPWIQTPNAVVTIFIGVAQALAYAHRRGIVHQDIKPENIMLGEYGEVLVVDWGSAERLQEGIRPRLYGTPLYMSPEQARSESVDRRSDVYCLGATLLHVLLLRLPVWSEDVDAFWAHKRTGHLDPISAAERRLAPGALLSITLKALAPKPEDRYADAGAMLKDLQDYQAGLAVSAHHDSWRERWLRFHRRHGRQLWLGLALAALVAGLVGIIVHERLKERASWGEPVVAADFTSDADLAHWLPFRGHFTRQSGQIVSDGDGDNIIIYDRKFVGATAIEYDAECLPGIPVCDLSAMWITTVAMNDNHTRITNLGRHYKFQFGANDGSFSLISTLADGDRGQHHLGYSPIRPSFGHTYHVRAEVADNHLELSIDGKVVCSYTQSFAFSSGYFGLFGFYQNKAFRHVRIYSRGISQKVSATAIGDSYVQNGDLDEAEIQYAWVSRSHPDTALGREAIYKEGICRYQQGDYAQAFRIWEPLRHSEYAPLIRLQDIDTLIRTGTTAQVIAAMDDFCMTATPDQRKRLALLWGDIMWKRIAQKNRSDMSALLVFHQRALADQKQEDSTVAQALLDLHRDQEILDQYPEQRIACALALDDRCEFRRTYVEYPDQIWPCGSACFMIGVDDHYGLMRQRYLYSLVLANEGHFDQARALVPDLVNQVAIIDALQGRLDEGAACIPKLDWDKARILCLAGRQDEIRNDPTFGVMADLVDGHPRRLVGGDPTISMMAAMAEDLIAFRAWRDGDHRLPGPSYDPIVNQDWQGTLRNAFVAFAVPLMRQQAGDHGALARACTQIETEKQWWDRQRLYYMARYLDGSIDDATYLKHPWPLKAPSELHLLKALRADAQGQAAEAVAQYQAWTAYPVWQREDLASPVWREFIAWRIAQLAPASAPAPATAPTPVSTSAASP